MLIRNTFIPHLEYWAFTYTPCILSLSLFEGKNWLIHSSFLHQLLYVSTTHTLTWYLQILTFICFLSTNTRTWYSYQVIFHYEFYYLININWMRNVYWWRSFMALYLIYIPTYFISIFSWLILFSDYHMTSSTFMLLHMLYFSTLWKLL